MLPKRHRRTIAYKDRQYSWHFTAGREFDHRAVPQLVVQAADGGQLLLVRQAAWPEVTPAVVVQLMEEAIMAGWQDTAEKGQFVFNR